jgi:hypothetical protein
LDILSIGHQWVNHTYPGAAVQHGTFVPSPRCAGRFSHKGAAWYNFLRVFW